MDGATDHQVTGVAAHVAQEILGRQGRMEGTQRCVVQLGTTDMAAPVREAISWKPATCGCRNWSAPNLASHGVVLSGPRCHVVDDLAAVDAEWQQWPGSRHPFVLLLSTFAIVEEQWAFLTSWFSTQFFGSGGFPLAVRAVMSLLAGAEWERWHLHLRCLRRPTKKFWKLLYGRMLYGLHRPNQLLHPPAQAQLHLASVSEQPLHELVQTHEREPYEYVGMERAAALRFHRAKRCKYRSHSAGASFLRCAAIWAVATSCTPRFASTPTDAFRPHTKHELEEELNHLFENDDLPCWVARQAHCHFSIRRELVVQAHFLALNDQEQRLLRVGQVRSDEDQGRAPGERE